MKIVILILLAFNFMARAGTIELKSMVPLGSFDELNIDKISSLGNSFVISRYWESLHLYDGNSSKKFSRYSLFNEWFSPSGKYIAASIGENIEIIDVAGKASLKKLRMCPRSFAMEARFSSDEKMLAAHCVGGKAGKDSNGYGLVVWSWMDGKEILRKFSSSMLFSFDLLVTGDTYKLVYQEGDSNHGIHSIDLKTLAVENVVPNEEFFLGAEAQIVANRYFVGALYGKIFDLQKNQIVNIGKILPKSSASSRFVFSQDGKLAIFWDQFTGATFIDLENLTAKPIMNSQGQKVNIPIAGAVFSHDSKRLAIVSVDEDSKSLLIFDSKSLQILGAIDEFNFRRLRNPIQFNAAGNLVMSAFVDNKDKIPEWHAVEFAIH
jgi:hypothetical protein